MPNDVRKSAAFAETDSPSAALMFPAVAAQFGLIVLLVVEFHLESETFARLMQLALAGFLVHHFLPLRYRLPFFACLSVTATVVATDLVSGLTLFGIGLGLIGLCHLPISFRARIAALVVAGFGLSVLRVNFEWFARIVEQGLGRSVPGIQGIWTILGSMFVFRIMVYMYDLKHRAATFSPARAIAYFFMIPNVCFPLFPIVDYKTWCSTYFNAPSERIYQVGLKWMFRGVLQLLLYRLVYRYGLMDIRDVASATDVARYMVATYLLYLHVSGQFHMIVGLLHMFGFNLPETHHLYLLAGSFTDFWRRINIYWKDFIMKIAFYPAFFAIRRIGPLKAMALATLAAFFATWLLHSWQYFWFRGEFLVSWQDISFWTILAVLVLANALIEAVSGRKRSLTKPRFDLAARWRVGLKTIGTFVVICTLWTIWSCQSSDELHVLADCATRFSWTDAAIIVMGLAAIGAAGMVWGASSREGTEGSPAAAASRRPFLFWRSALAVGVPAAMLLATPAVWHAAFGEKHGLLAALSEDRLNDRDRNMQRRGYYEELDFARANFNLWEPEGWKAGADVLYRQRQDFLATELVPNCSTEFLGATTTINRWGMRDRDYDRQKPRNTYRIVLIGASNEMGYGVNNDETFENLVEERLALDPPDARYTRYEVLNLSVGGFSFHQRLWRLEREGFDFSPDAVLFVVFAAEAQFVTEHLSRAARRNWELPYDEIRDTFAKAHVQANLPALVIQQRIQPYVPELMGEVFGRLAAVCREHDVRPMVVYRPEPLDPTNLESGARARTLRLASAANVEFVDLSSAFDDVPGWQTLVVAPWDDHTNAAGHRLLADRLFDELAARLSPAAHASAHRETESSLGNPPSLTPQHPSGAP